MVLVFSAGTEDVEVRRPYEGSALATEARAAQQLLGFAGHVLVFGPFGPGLFSGQVLSFGSV